MKAMRVTKCKCQKGRQKQTVAFQIFKLHSVSALNPTVSPCILGGSLNRASMHASLCTAHKPVFILRLRKTVTGGGRQSTAAFAEGEEGGGGKWE